MQWGDVLLIVAQAHQYLRALGVDIVAQVGGVNTGVGRYLLLVERLYSL